MFAFSNFVDEKFFTFNLKALNFIIGHKKDVKQQVSVQEIIDFQSFQSQKNMFDFFMNGSIKINSEVIKNIKNLITKKDIGLYKELKKNEVYERIFNNLFETKIFN